MSCSRQFLENIDLQLLSLYLDLKVLGFLAESINVSKINELDSFISE